MNDDLLTELGRSLAALRQTRFTGAARPWVLRRFADSGLGWLISMET